MDSVQFYGISSPLLGIEERGISYFSQIYSSILPSRKHNKE